VTCFENHGGFSFGPRMADSYHPETDALSKTTPVPVPKLASTINPQTAISVSLILSIGGGVFTGIYNYAYQQGKNENVEKNIAKLETRLERIEKNIYTICAHVKNCTMSTHY
jgi:hypothetical protein